jgi:hypothetical protein
VIVFCERASYKNILSFFFITCSSFDYLKILKVFVLIIAFEVIRMSVKFLGKNKVPIIFFCIVIFRSRSDFRNLTAWVRRRMFEYVCSKKFRFRSTENPGSSTPPRSTSRSTSKSRSSRFGLISLNNFEAIPRNCVLTV